MAIQKIQEKGKESCYYKEYGNLQYLSMLIQQMQINHCNQIEQYPQLNSTETIMSDFSMLSDKVQEMDENYQDLQYQNNQESPWGEPNGLTVQAYS